MSFNDLDKQDSKVKEIKRSADVGCASAQNNLAICYYKGEGVTQSIFNAELWFKKSAAQGNKVAKKNLKKLRKVKRKKTGEISTASKIVTVLLTYILMVAGCIILAIGISNIEEESITASFEIIGLIFLLYLCKGGINIAVFIYAQKQGGWKVTRVIQNILSLSLFALVLVVLGFPELPTIVLITALVINFILMFTNLIYCAKIAGELSNFGATLGAIATVAFVATADAHIVKHNEDGTTDVSSVHFL